MFFPLSTLQNWPTPNYVNPERRGPAATIVVSVLLGLVTLILIIRIYTRVRISRGFGLDDVLIIFAYVRLSRVAFVRWAKANGETDTNGGICCSLILRHVEIRLGHSRMGSSLGLDQAKHTVQVGALPGSETVAPSS